MCEQNKFFKIIFKQPCYSFFCYPWVFPQKNNIIFWNKSKQIFCWFRSLGMKKNNYIAHFKSDIWMYTCWKFKFINYIIEKWEEVIINPAWRVNQTVWQIFLAMIRIWSQIRLMFNFMTFNVKIVLRHYIFVWFYNNFYIMIWY